MSSYSANTVPGAGGCGVKSNCLTAHLSTTQQLWTSSRDRGFSQQGRQYSYSGQDDIIRQAQAICGTCERDVMETRGEGAVLEIGEMVANFSCQMEVALRFPPRH